LSFLFSFKNFVPVTAKNRVRVTVSSRVSAAFCSDGTVTMYTSYLW